MNKILTKGRLHWFARPVIVIFMKTSTVLINFAALDPPRNGGTSRIGLHVSRLLQSLRDVRVVFAVNLAFVSQFEEWLGARACIVPINTGGYYGQSQAARITRALRPDFIISPLFGAEPFQQMTGPVHIVGMPDTLALERPELFSEHDVAYRRKLYEQLKTADRVVTISQFAADQLVKNAGLLRERVDVVLLGGDPAPPDASVAPPVSGKYWFYPANAWPHKRHELLLRAFAIARQRDPTLTLALTGDGGSFHAAYGAKLAELGLDDSCVRHLGYVSNAALMALYHHAEALVFVSSYEGFGMPLLEAMVAGCPVVCAPLTAIPEVAGDAALYVRDDTPEGWARAVQDELPGQRDRLIAAGYARAPLFTWDKMREGWREALAQAGLPTETGAPPPFRPRFDLNSRMTLPDGSPIPQNTKFQKALSVTYLWALQSIALARAKGYIAR